LKNKYGFFLVILSSVLLGFIQTPSKEKLLMSYIWKLENKEGPIHTLYFNADTVKWIYGDTSIEGGYYLSDDIDGYFDYSKIGANQNGNYLVIQTGKSPDKHVELQIITINQTSLILKNVEQSFNITFSAAPK
jgi:hypothetical protein